VTKKSVRVSLSAVVLGVVVWLLIVSLLTVRSFNHLQQLQFSQAYEEATIASFLFWPVDQTLARVNGDIALWGSSLRLMVTSGELGAELQLYLPEAVNGNTVAEQNAQRIAALLPSFQTQLRGWLQAYQHAAFFPQLLNTRLPTQAQQLLQRPDDVLRLSQEVVDTALYLLRGQHRLIALLQNSDELRATGGFMGSYASLQLTNGVVTQLEVQDIYVPDGQFTDFVQPPPGVAEYLSGGKGFRLPDANWSPDFPASAQEVMKFFALGKEQSVEGVVAVNVEVVEELLKLTGPIYLPDYKQTVTAENLSTLARADRNQFFPGSQQKRQFLQSLFTFLKLRLGDTLQQKPQEFIRLFSQFAERKDIQAFAHAEQLQTLFGELGMTGQLRTSGSQRYFFSVESNVGINKANRLVTRTAELQLEATRTTLTLSFQNQNPITSLKEERGDYINYQRILVPAEYQVQQLVVSNPATHQPQQLTAWDEQLITTIAGEQLKQIGFLVTVPAKSTANVQLILSHPDLPFEKVMLQKQSGLPPTPYHIQTPTSAFDVLLEQDILLDLN